MYRLLLIPLSLALLSCASRPLPEPEPTSQPGITPLLDATAIWKQYDCDSKKLPFIIIEQEEITPSSVQAGKEFQHRFVYAACTASAQQPIKGSVSRKIDYKNRAVFQDITRDFEIKPGRSEVKAMVTIPAKAKPGNYVFDLAVISPTTTVEKKLPFLVRR